MLYKSYIKKKAHFHRFLTHIYMVDLSCVHTFSTGFYGENAVFSSKDRYGFF